MFPPACTLGRARLNQRRPLAARRFVRCSSVRRGGYLSPLTINGFASLEVLSGGIANPFSTHRDGINIGEGAAAFLLTREADFWRQPAVYRRYGASSDAYHMSSPRPDG